MSTSLRLLGFAGPAGVGKSTAAQLLVHQAGWRLVSFADPLRRLALQLRPEWTSWHFGPGKEVTPDGGGLTPRETLRVLGDGIKAFYPRAFVEVGALSIQTHLLADHPVVVDDVRFETEAEAIRDLGGVVVHVQRAGVGFRRDHNSEQGIAVHPDDLTLVNPGDLLRLQGELGQILSQAARQTSAALRARDQA
jgi:hypothetical protein